jgi:WD40 repeat protein/tRNA A-37 threonylcarbamoyl transferase component Bud32
MPAVVPIMASAPQRIGKYEILAELGRGAMGTVYKARDPRLDRLVAVKMMSEELLIEEEMRGRFHREAKSAANLQHPNIVTVFDFGEVQGEGSPYIVMELLEGESLAALMEAKKPERLQDKVDVVIQVCRGLDYAHKRGVVHRDVKPGNVQVLPNGTAKILDFGIARGDGSTMKTKTGLVMGTPNYMAPEQIASDERVDHRADMWAVGVILYELLSGARPFTATTIPALVYQIVHSPPPPLDERKLGLPPRLVAVVERVLQKDPDKRFRDLAHLARTLEKVIGAPVVTPEISSEARARGYTTNLDLARSLLSQGQPQRALEAARRAQALEPSHRSVVDLIQEIEIALRRMQSQETVVQAPAPGERSRFDAARWVDEARMALTAGERSEALRIVDDVLAVAPGFPPAVELKELLDKPARPGRVRSGSLRPQTYRQARVRPELAFAEISTFGEPPGIQVLAAAPQPGLVAAGGVDGSIRLWDVDARRKVAVFRTALHQRAGHEALVTSLAFSPGGAFLASGHVDGNVHLWALDTGDEVQVKIRHDASVGQLAFSPDGETLASGGLDSTLKLWELRQIRQGEAQRRLVRQPSGVTSLVYSRDGALLITGHTNRVIRLYDVRNGRLVATLRGHEGAVSTATVSPDGSQLATGGRDCTIRIFDLNRREEVHVLAGHRKAVAALSYLPSGTEIASVAMEHAVILWDAASGAQRTTLWGAKGETFSSVAITGEEPLVVAGLGDGRLRVWAPE